jgi:hypothetical protein
MIRKGFKKPKWILTNHKWPTIWINTIPTPLENSWVIDMRR